MRSTEDDIFHLNNPMCSFIGTILMVVAFMMQFSAFSITVVEERYQVEVICINCLVAASAGGLSALLFKNLLLWRRQRRIKSNKHSFDTQELLIPYLMKGNRLGID